MKARKPWWAKEWSVAPDPEKKPNGILVEYSVRKLAWPFLMMSALVRLEAEYRASLTADEKDSP